MGNEAIYDILKKYIYKIYLINNLNKILKF